MSVSVCCGWVKIWINSSRNISWEVVVCSEKSTELGVLVNLSVYLELVYLVTALVPSETACLASSPGRRSLTEVWISLEVMVDLLL